MVAVVPVEAVVMPWHDEEPGGLLLYAEQLLQEDAFPSEYVPAEQFIHALSIVAPLVGLYVPGGHAVQLDEACEGPYIPMGHLVHDVDPA